MNFFVGQKVVCLRDAWLFWPGYKPFGWPVTGSTYTIRSITEDRTGIGFLFFEFANPHIYRTDLGSVMEPGFAAQSGGIANFRPVVEYKTDIGIFTKMLAPTKREGAGMKQTGDVMTHGAERVYRAWLADTDMPVETLREVITSVTHPVVRAALQDEIERRETSKQREPA